MEGKGYINKQVTIELKSDALRQSIMFLLCDAGSGQLLYNCSFTNGLVLDGHSCKLVQGCSLKKSAGGYKSKLKQDSVLDLNLPKLNLKECVTGLDLLDALENFITDLFSGEAHVSEVKGLLEVDDFVPASIRDGLESMSDLSEMQTIATTYEDSSSQIPYFYRRPIVRLYDFHQPSNGYSGKVSVSFGNRFSVCDEEQNLISKWIEQTNEVYKPEKHEGNCEPGSFAYVWKLESGDSYFDFNDSLWMLSENLKEAEMLATFSVEENTAGYKYKGYCWSIAGLDGCIYKHYYFENKPFIPFLEAEKLTGVQEYVEVPFKDGPIDIQCALRRSSRGAALNPGDELGFKASIYHGRPEFVEGHPNEISPFVVKPISLPFPRKPQGNLSFNPQVSKCLALSKYYGLGSCPVLSVKSLGPFTVTVDLEPKDDNHGKKRTSQTSASTAYEESIKADWGFRREDPGCVFYKGLDMILTVPEKIGKRQVTGLGSECFATMDDDGARLGYSKNAIHRAENMREVICPPTIKIIGSCAFTGCSVRKLTIPATIEDVYDSAFHLSAVKEIVIYGSKGDFEYAKEILCEAIEGTDIVLTLVDKWGFQDGELFLF